MRTPRGFTLIELLVVVAVIGTLVGMMMPVVSMINEGAKGTRCRGNLRQLGLAMISYAGANRGFYAPMNLGSSAEANDPVKGSNGKWYTNLLLETGHIDPTLMNHGAVVNIYGDVRTGVWRCPAATTAQLYWGGGYGLLEDFRHGFWYAGSTAVPLTARRVQRASQRAMLLDDERWVISAYRTSPSVRCPVDPSTAWDTRVDPDFRAAARHGKNLSANVVFFDGHVTMLRVADLKANVDDVWGHSNP